MAKRIYKEDKKILTRAISIMDKYEVSNINSAKEKLEYISSNYNENDRYLRYHYNNLNRKKRKEIEKELKLQGYQYNEIKQLIDIFDKYQKNERNGITEELAKREEWLGNKGKHSIVMSKGFIAVVCGIITLVGSLGTKKIEQSEKDTQETQIWQSNKINMDLTQQEIDNLLNEYSKAYTKAIENKLDTNKVPLEYFKGIIEDGCEFGEEVNNYISDNYDIDKYTYTMNYKEGVFLKDEGIIFVKSANIDSVNNETGDPIIKPKDEKNNAAFRIKEEKDNGESKIIITDKLDNEELNQLIKLNQLI